MAHSPGPWTATYTKREYIIRDALGQHLDDHFVDRPAAEHEANARLIAAAPDLLEALKHARNNMRHPDQMIDEAIAKAEGR